MTAACSRHLMPIDSRVITPNVNWFARESPGAQMGAAHTEIWLGIWWAARGGARLTGSRRGERGPMGVLPGGRAG